ncbi:MAG TPA: DNA primase [Tepidisphaeraceae bacterium]|nr:DNA primase [Tepidisphaeraceae bacterium]
MNGSNASGTDFKAQVLQAIDIVDLIGQSVSLKRRGKDFVGLCPFHQEKTPSFHVSPSKQFFHCYGCKAGGNAIDFVIKRDRVEFIDALRTLGEMAGLEMPRHGGGGGNSREKAGERQQLLEACSAACALFEKMLADPQRGLPARKYLETRGFDAASVQRFQVGFAPDAWDTLLRSPLLRKVPPQVLALAGLVKPRQGGDGYYDTFRNRVMFPIRDENGRVIAFGGRVMPGSEDPAKYLNSPETPLFSKSRSVFGLDLARQRVVETRTVAVVEGYTDVVMAHQFGASNVVSILGTAMTEQHVTVLRRFADRIVLLFDADTAGDTAVNRAVELFLTQPVEIAIAAMPDGVDPDEFLLEQGAEAFEKVLAAASDALTFKWRQLDRQFRASDDLTGRQKAVGEYLSLLASARGSGPVDSLRWGQALSRVSRLTEIPVDELHRKFGRTRASAPARPRAVQGAAVSEPTNKAPVRRGPLTAQDRAERQILGILLVQPGKWNDVQRTVHVEDFTDPTRRTLADVFWQHQRDEGEPVFNEFLSLLSGAELTELAIGVVEEVEALKEQLGSLDDTLRDAVLHLEEVRRRREEQKLVARLRRTEGQLGEQDEVSLLKKLQEQARHPDLRRVGS